MTTLDDDFDTIDPATWAKNVLLGGDIVTLNSVAQSTHVTAGNYLYFIATGASAVAITGVSATNPTVIDLAPALHGYQIGQQFWVRISGNTSTTVPATEPVDGTHLATATSTTAFTVPRNVTAAVVNGTATVTLQGANQKATAFLYSAIEGAQAYAIVWARFDRIGTPVTALRAGYGAALLYEAGGTRTLKLYKISPTDGSFLELASKGVVLAKVSDTDLGVLQSVTLVVRDEQVPGSHEFRAVLRVYINEAHDGLPTLEHFDDGRHLLGFMQPPHRAPGTWALTFGAAGTTGVLAFTATDESDIPESKIETRDYSTLGELRALLEAELSIGGRTGYATTLLNLKINTAIEELRIIAGDKGYPFHRTLNAAISEDGQRLVTMPFDCDRVLAIYDGTTFAKMDWEEVVKDDLGRSRVHVLPAAGGRLAMIQYALRKRLLVKDDDLSPVPNQFDQLVILHAARRMTGLQGMQKTRAALDVDYQESLSAFMHWLTQSQRSRKLVMSAWPRRRSNYQLDLTGWNPWA